LKFKFKGRRVGVFGEVFVVATPVSGVFRQRVRYGRGYRGKKFKFMV